MSLTRTVWPDKFPYLLNKFYPQDGGHQNNSSAVDGNIFVYTAKNATYNSTGNIGIGIAFEKDDTTGWKDITPKYKLVPSDTFVSNFVTML